jgi:hypothetical protein
MNAKVHHVMIFSSVRFSVHSVMYQMRMDVPHAIVQMTHVRLDPYEDPHLPQVCIIVEV